MRTRLAAILAITSIPLIACGSSDSPADAADKYKQTWTTPYSATACTAFLGEMTEQQRWAAAADMLASARNKMDGGSGLPTDLLITRFAADISTACAGEGLAKIAEVAVLVYQMDPSYKP